jgi:hypothetical protein
MTNEQRQVNQMLLNGILESHRHMDTILTQICHLTALLHTTFTTTACNMVSNIHKKIINYKHRTRQEIYV